MTKSDERIKIMIKANKELHELGDGYALFWFAKDEDIDLKRFYEDIFGRHTVKASIPLETTTCLYSVVSVGKSSCSFGETPS